MEVAVVGAFAGAVAKTVVGPPLENLISILKKQFSLIKDVEKDVTELVSKLSAIRAVLEDAEERQDKSKAIADWLRKLQDATFGAEDVLDTLSLDIQQQDMQSPNQVSPSFSFSLNPKNILFRRKIAKKIKKIIRVFDKIAVEKSQFQFSNPVVLPSKPQFNKDRETTSLIKEPQIYGRDENTKKIVDILVNDFVNQDKVSVFPIVGMGGLGKTTLAQSIYNDQTLQTHFQLKIWVCVSEPFDLERVLKAIVESVDKKACDLLSLQAVCEKVEGMLRKERYLIVLDDVWTEMQDDWNSLKSVFKGEAKGSSVVLTTRSATVAAMTGSISPFPIMPLSDDKCFSLFRSRALGDKDEEVNSNLVAIGKDIAKKCKGVPLVAKSLGSLLRFQTDEKQWELIRDSEIWTLSETAENTVIAALRLSYNHLPAGLKLCFAYCSLFRKAYVMGKTELIYTWIANGFVQNHDKMELEEVGDNMFNELLRLSFLQASKEDTCGNILTCKMHDLMHDLASSVASNDCLIARVGETKHVPSTLRHLTLICNSPQSPTDLDHILHSQPSLRTLCFFYSIDFHRFQFSSTLRLLGLINASIQTLPPLVCDLKHLRYLVLSHNLLTSLPESLPKLRNLQVLDLRHNIGITTFPLPICKLEHLRYLNISYCERLASLPQSIHELKNLRNLDLTGNGEITTLPDSIGNLKLLRYLNLSYCKSLSSLPETISGLRNLQSLLLRGCRKLKALPQNIKDMSGLRHLDNCWCVMLSEMPVGIRKLKCLQTLKVFEVRRQSNDESGESAADISELQELDQLKGVLAIAGLENVRNGEDAKQANLRSKKYLINLELFWRMSRQVDNSKEVLEGLLPLPPNLQELLIFGYTWEASFPEVFLQNLKALKFFGISQCDKMVSLPEGLLLNLTSLRKLDIVKCKRLKRLGLTGIQGGLNPNTATSSSSSTHLQSCLQILHINDCPELVLSEEDFQNLNGLTSLWLQDLPQFTALPQGIQQLPMLQELTIKNWQNLRTLPEWIKRLTSLRYLEITNCHEELHKRCEKDKGEDWHLISHITDVISKKNNSWNRMEISWTRARTNTSLSIVKIEGMPMQN